jgi:hypothetical protein
MPNRRLSMRKIKEVLRLKYDCGISEREISRSCQISRSTVADYLRRATVAGLTWDEAAALNQTELEGRLRRVESGPFYPVGGQDRRGHRPAGGKYTGHTCLPGAGL